MGAQVTVQASVLAITPDDILLLEPSEQDAFVAMLDKIADAHAYFRREVH